jgi:negative regulator of flagellin synthesis FlgM
MKIYGIPKGGVEEARSADGPRRKEKGQPMAGSGRGQDRVSLSAESRQLLEAEKAAQARSDERARRLEEIRTQIQNGTYRPDSTAVAARMLEDVFRDFQGG